MLVTSINARTDIPNGYYSNRVTNVDVSGTPVFMYDKSTGVLSINKEVVDRFQFGQALSDLRHGMTCLEMRIRDTTEPVYFSNVTNIAYLRQGALRSTHISPIQFGYAL
jgi:hypothetical protein